MKIAQATEKELQELAQFARDTYSHAYGQELGVTVLDRHLRDQMSDDVFSQILANDTVLLALGENEIVGFAQVGVVNQSYSKYLEVFDSSGRELRRLYVKPELQYQGIGSALFGRSLAEGIPQQSRHMYVTTWESNSSAQRFYTKHGFEMIGKIPEYSEQGSLNGYEHIMIRTQ